MKAQSKWMTNKGFDKNLEPLFFEYNFFNTNLNDLFELFQIKTLFEFHCFYD
jgi:hypothetical protein